MGYRTDFVGVIEIYPHLNEAEHSYLTAFAESRRYRRQGADEYYVPDNPLAGPDAPAAGRDGSNVPPLGQPGLWCPWTPGGVTCLHISDHGDGKHYAPAGWLTYLVDHFLRPDAVASRRDDERFAQFSFDHRVEGAVAAYRHDTARLWLIRAFGTEIVEQTIVAGHDEVPDWIAETDAGMNAC